MCRSFEKATMTPKSVSVVLSPLKQELDGAAVRIKDIRKTHVSLLVVLVPV